MTDKEVNKMKKKLTKWEEEQQKQFEEYCRKSETIMWRGVGIFCLILFVAIILWGIVHK